MLFRGRDRIVDFSAAVDLQTLTETLDKDPLFILWTKRQMKIQENFIKLDNQTTWMLVSRLVLRWSSGSLFTFAFCN